MACTANHNYHLVARRHYILTTQGGHECTRPTPIQLATVVSSQQPLIDTSVNGIEATCPIFAGPVTFIAFST